MVKAMHATDQEQIWQREGWNSFEQALTICGFKEMTRSGYDLELCRCKHPTVSFGGRPHESLLHSVVRYQMLKRLRGDKCSKGSRAARRKTRQPESIQLGKQGS